MRGFLGVSLVVRAVGVGLEYFVKCRERFCGLVDEIEGFGEGRRWGRRGGRVARSVVLLLWVKGKEIVFFVFKFCFEVRGKLFKKSF